MIDRRIKFRHIQCFIEIARAQSLKAAAERLHLTQPAISKTLKELEGLLGKPLLNRSRAGVGLTLEGEVFLSHAEASIASIQQGITGLKSGGQAGLKPLAVGVLPSVAARLIPAAASAFSQSAPDTVLRLLDGPHGFLVERLKLGELDLVLGRMGDHDQMKGISFTTLYRERISFVVRQGHPLLQRPRLDAIVDWPIVFPSAGSAIRPSVDRYLIERGLGEIPRRIETVSGAFGRVFTQHTDAIWIISEGVVANEIANGLLTRLPFETDTTLGPIGIMNRADWAYDLPAKQFVRVLQQTIAALPDISG